MKIFYSEKLKEELKVHAGTNNKIAQAVRNKVITYTDGVAEAKIVNNRGALITASYAKYLPANPLFGDKSCNMDDSSLFFMNIRENAKKIATFMENASK